MLTSLQHALRMIKAGLVLAQYDVLVPSEFADQVPPAARYISRLARRWAGRFGPQRANIADTSPGRRLALALQALGPAYIKLGQFLATRPDLIGAELAADLRYLQDRLPPFATAQAKAIIEAELGVSSDELFDEFSDPVAAASIAQVHRARIRHTDKDTEQLTHVAVKVLRPGIEQALAKDLGAFGWAARMAERHWPSMKRLEPVKLIDTLRDSMTIEMDLRLEAAAASELKENDAPRDMLRIPTIDWRRTSRRVLTAEWIDAIPIGNLEALKAANIDTGKIAADVVQVFLTQALFDGFFHADMHQGNLFVDQESQLVAVDFGIMGRLDPDTRRYLAEILLGFLSRDYQNLADIHIAAGYVPSGKSRDAFAQALRSVGEPIFGRNASEISMARLLAQLFQITDSFDMHLQPQLVLLQKTMVVVEGVARSLDPDLNIWEVSRPIVTQWMEDHMSPEARIREAAQGAASLGRTLSQLPEALRNAEAIGAMMRRDGLRLHPETAKAIAMADREQNKTVRVAVWVGAVALAVIALAAVF
ncbi:MAG: 2-polyprenylphenol 6-hydroxylase [Alphaproteobacteria bacterium]|nr:MAG: 2-polyprenylphenol 6-hydroxylase [Alphaproteobacteria bacterium]